MSDFGLVQVNVTTDPHELQARAHETMSALEADERPGAVQLGADPSNSITRPSLTTAGWSTCRSVGDGARAWPLVDLGFTILAAYQQAKQKQSIARTRSADAADQRSEPDTRRGNPMPNADDPCWLDWNGRY